MTTRKTPLDSEKQALILKKLRDDAAARRNSYRERALRLFPHVCASCKREFSGRRINELTVHHKDCNHENNPPDGSNWELLCIYCHDNEHEKFRLGGCYGGSKPGSEPPDPVFTPFEGLDALIKLPAEKSDTGENAAGKKKDGDNLTI